MGLKDWWQPILPGPFLGFSVSKELPCPLLDLSINQNNNIIQFTPIAVNISTVIPALI